MSLHDDVKRQVEEMKNTSNLKNNSVGLDVNEEKILKRMEDMGLKPDLSLIKSGLMSNISDTSDKMFEEFLKMVKEFNSDENVFKVGTLPKDGSKTYWLSLGATVSEVPKIKALAAENKTKPRYYFSASFMKNYNIGLSAEKQKYGNRSDQIKEIMMAFVNFKSLLMYREAGRFAPESEENTPSEKLRKGFLARR